VRGTRKAPREYLLQFWGIIEDGETGETLSVEHMLDSEASR
jgi:hypothetical protein